MQWCGTDYSHPLARSCSCYILTQCERGVELHAVPAAIIVIMVEPAAADSCCALQVCVVVHMIWCSKRGKDSSCSELN